LHHLPCLVDALRDAWQAEFLKALVKRTALATVERDHLRRVGDAGERRERALRDALLSRLSAEGLQPDIEAGRIVTAGRRARGERKRDGEGNQSDNGVAPHEESSGCPDRSGQKPRIGDKKEAGTWFRRAAPGRGVPSVCLADRKPSGPGL